MQECIVGHPSNTPEIYNMNFKKTSKNFQQKYTTTLLDIVKHTFNTKNVFCLSKKV